MQQQIMAQMGGQAPPGMEAELMAQLGGATKAVSTDAGSLISEAEESVDAPRHIVTHATASMVKLVLGAWLVQVTDSFDNGNIPANKASDLTLTLTLRQSP